MALVAGLTANAIDTVATWLGIRHGWFSEANPVVRHLGLAPKAVIVSALFVLLYRLQPRVLWLVTTACLLIICYHVLGVALTI